MKVFKTITGSPTMADFQKMFLAVAKALQGNISFGTTFAPDSFAQGYTGGPTANIDRDINIRHFKASGVTPSTANTTFNITNTAPFFQDGHVPMGVLTAAVDQAAIIYVVNIATWSNTSISLRCNVASVNYRVILI